VSARAGVARRVAAGAGALAAAAGLASCGGAAPDLLLVERTGTIPGAELTLRLTDDGRVSCNGGPLVDVSSEQLIDARQAVRDLEGEDDEVGPADRNLRLPRGPANGPASILAYEATVRDPPTGTVTWSDTSPRQPPVLQRLALLTRQIAQGPCGLER
jgi:hypothetical protein